MAKSTDILLGGQAIQVEAPAVLVLTGLTMVLERQGFCLRAVCIKKLDSSGAILVLDYGKAEKEGGQGE